MNSAELEAIQRPGPIILYDGLCALCDSSVQYILDRDSKRQFRFASLQSEIGQAFASGDDSTIVLIDDGHSYVRSAAIIRICRRLGPPYNFIATISSMIPNPLLDAMYNWIARNRYQWFGRRTACRLPTPETAGRFL